MAQLNRFIPDNQLPNVLLRPLVFGDRSQINAFNELEAIIEEMETERAKHCNKDVRFFDVTIKYSARYETQIWATSERAAIKKAREESDVTESDFEEDYVNASECHYKRPRAQQKGMA